MAIASQLYEKINSKITFVEKLFRQTLCLNFFVNLIVAFLLVNGLKH